MRLRLVVVAAVIAVAVAAVGTRHGRAPTFGPGGSSPQGLVPVVQPEAALSSTFYCAGGSIGPKSDWDQTVVLANTTDRPITATVEIFPADASEPPPLDQTQLAIPTTSTTTPESASGSPAPATTTSTSTTTTTTTTTPATTTTVAPVPSRKLVAVPARSTARVPLAGSVNSAYAAASVEVNGGGVAVEAELNGPLGTLSQPCATSASPQWYFAGGDTRRDAQMRLALFNPFADDAVVDLSFVGDGRRLEPEAYQGMLVPRGRLVLLDFTPAPPASSQVDRIADLAITVTARQGSLVAERLQAANGTGELPAGIAATYGSPAVNPLWSFPYAQVTDDVSQVFTIYNPGDSEADVDLEVSVNRADAGSATLDAAVGGTAATPTGQPAATAGTAGDSAPPATGDTGDTGDTVPPAATTTVPGTTAAAAVPATAPTTVPPAASIPPPPAGSPAPTSSTVPPQQIEPFALTVPPHSSNRVELAPDPDTSADPGVPRLAAGRVPVGPQFSVTVRVRSGPGVVAQQLWRSKILAPPPSGFSMMLGLPVLARHWEMAAGPGAANDPRHEFLVVGNPGATDATVSVRGLRGAQQVPVGGDTPVPGGDRAVIDVSGIAPGTLAVEVTASQPVTVERFFAPSAAAAVSGVQAVAVFPVVDAVSPLAVPDPFAAPVPTLPPPGADSDQSDTGTSGTAGPPASPDGAASPATTTSGGGAASAQPETDATQSPGGD